MGWIDLARFLWVCSATVKPTQALNVGKTHLSKGEQILLTLTVPRGAKVFASSLLATDRAHISQGEPAASWPFIPRGYHETTNHLPGTTWAIIQSNQS